MSALDMQAEAADLQIQDFFLNSDAPVFEDIDFDAAVDRLAADEMDAAASEAIERHFEQARSNGDLALLQKSAMLLGAMACLHEHMQELSERMTHDHLQEHDEAAHRNQNKTEEEGLKTRSKEQRAQKKSKVQGFLESLFKKYRNRKAQPAGLFSLFG